MANTAQSQQLRVTADPKVSNTAWTQTPHIVLPGTILSLQASPCLQ